MLNDTALNFSFENRSGLVNGAVFVSLTAAWQVIVHVLQLH